MSDIYIPTIQDFIALARRNNFARVDRFLIDIVPPKGMGVVNSVDKKDIQLLCEEAAFPGKTLETRTLRINALNEKRAHTLNYMGDSITLTFLVDTTWNIRTFFEMWMNICVGETSTKSPLREVGFYDDYIADIMIYSLDLSESKPLSERGPPITKNIPGLKDIIANYPKLPPLQSFPEEKSYLSNLKARLGGLSPKSVAEWGVGQMGLDTLLKKEIAKTQAKALLLLNAAGQTNYFINRATDLLNSELTNALGDRLQIHEPAAKEKDLSVAELKIDPQEAFIMSKQLLNIPEYKADESYPAERVLLGMTLHEAWPTSISMQTMSSSQTEQYHRLTVTFTYKWYELSKESA